MPKFVIKPIVLKFLYFLLMLFFQTYLVKSQVIETTKDLIIDEGKATIKTRYTLPKGFYWEKTEPGSFGEFLENFPLYPSGFPVRDYQKIPVENQTKHAGVLRIDVGEKDLQQCADAWIRLYAEYLFLNKKYNEIGFHFTSGQFLSWDAYKNGVRTFEKNEVVTLKKTEKFNDSYENFRNYLNVIFQYAGTISLDKEGVEIEKNEDIKAGDFLINPGSPGHTVIIMGVIKNNLGKRLYLLAESYMPAQNIHILNNPINYKISPWYELDVNATKIQTAKYVFLPHQIKRFYKQK